MYSPIHYWPQALYVCPYFLLSPIKTYSVSKELEASLSAKMATCELYQDMNYVNAGSASCILIVAIILIILGKKQE